MKGERIEAFSAGIESHGLDPVAVKAMAECGVDMSGHRSKVIEELSDLSFDYVVTVCDNARESCPLFPGNVKVVHAGFPDPPHEARNAASEDEKLVHYRRIRDEIRTFVERLPEALEG